jgi:hypothetical protein
MLTSASGGVLSAVFLETFIITFLAEVRGLCKQVANCSRP